MTTYRVIKRNTPLNSGHRYGDLISDTEMKSRVIEALLANNIIVQASTPPLSELPGWEKRAEKLETVGIITIQNLLDTEPAEIAILLGYKRHSHIAKWQDNAREWIAGTVKPKRR